MKKSSLLAVLALGAGLWSLSLTSCAPSAAPQSAPQPAADANLIESTNYIGIWQKHVEVELTDDDGNTITAIQPTNLFKVIMPDGSYILFRAQPNGMPRSVDSRIEVYGSYKVIDEGRIEEHILTNCAKPELSGITSDVNYSLPDKDRMNVYYNLHNADGTAGSSEYVPEIWQRVPTSLR